MEMFNSITLLLGVFECQIPGLCLEFELEYGDLGLLLCFRLIKVQTYF